MNGFFSGTYQPQQFTELVSSTFHKNNCVSGSGSGVLYTQLYSSSISEDDLQTQITNDTSNFQTNGQAYANSNGTCAQVAPRS
jgi:hypothetical protein